MAFFTISIIIIIILLLLSFYSRSVASNVDKNSSAPYAVIPAGGLRKPPLPKSVQRTGVADALRHSRSKSDTQINVARSTQNENRMTIKEVSL